MATESESEIDAYAVLGVERGATQKEIRKAYHKLALQMHPDKVRSRTLAAGGGASSSAEAEAEAEEAKRKFQRLQLIFSVLSDPEKRKFYDETGSLEDSDGMTDLGGKDFDELYGYYRGMFARVTEEDIAAFEAKYRESEEERADLLGHYARLEGDMDKVFEFVLCSRASEDAERFCAAIEGAAAAGEVEVYDAFVRWRDERRRRKTTFGRETKRTTKTKKKIRKAAAVKEKENLGALMAQIRGKQKGRMEDMVSALEAKYANKKEVGRKKKKKKKKKGGGSSAGGEATEEEFLRARERLGL